MSRKKRRSGLFDLDTIDARIEENNSFKRVREQVGALQEANLADLYLTAGLGFTEDETLQLLAGKLTFQGVCNLRKAIQSVPSNITRFTRGKSLRASLVWEAFNALNSNCHISVSVDPDILSQYTEIIERWCPKFLEVHESKINVKNKFISPPVSSCVHCKGPLTMHNLPSRAVLFTFDGPIHVSKVTLECRGCSTRFGPCNYTDKQGSHFYPVETSNNTLLEVSNVTYFDLALYGWIPSLSNHCWVSFSGFSEAYNEVYQEQINEYAVRLEGSASSKEVNESVDQNIGVLPGEMSAKVVAKCFWHHEVHEELNECGLRDKWVFTSTKSGENTGAHDDVMEFIDRKRCGNLYNHTCSANCKQKGCGQLYVADGNWKLRYAHCMWKVPFFIPGFGNINYPSVCPLSPKRGHAFCEAHCEQAKSMGVEIGLKQLYQQCGVADLTIEEALDDMSAQPLLSSSSFEAVDNSLKDVTESVSSDLPNASTYQGTTDFLLSNPTFMEDKVIEKDLRCNKDTGGLKTLHFWSRGIFFIVSGGGHIEYWQPLYKSESPTQAFLITVLWLYQNFKNLEECGYSEESIIREMESTVLAYDNMCHMDNLLISRSDLPFPYPYSEVWKRIGKVIDRLHLRNHVDKKCHKMYNPDDKIKESFNTMACEQTFVWASRSKKVMCAMPHIHQFFFLHRMVKYRNAYTEKCHRRNKVPILPKVGKV